MNYVVHSLDVFEENEEIEIHELEDFIIKDGIAIIVDIPMYKKEVTMDVISIEVVVSQNQKRIAINANHINYVDD